MELDEQVEMLSRKIAQLFIELDGWESNDDDPDIFHHTIIWSKKISRMCLEKVVSKSDEKSHSYVMGAAGDLLLGFLTIDLIAYFAFLHDSKKSNASCSVLKFDGYSAFKIVSPSISK